MLTISAVGGAAFSLLASDNVDFDTICINLSIYQQVKSNSHACLFNGSQQQRRQRTSVVIVVAHYLQRHHVYNINDIYITETQQSNKFWTVGIAENENLSFK